MRGVMREIHEDVNDLYRSRKPKQTTDLQQSNIAEMNSARTRVNGNGEIENEFLGDFGHDEDDVFVGGGLPVTTVRLLVHRRTRILSYTLKSNNEWMY